jgi:glycosyltransferase involved in cell wall biosynthesis
MIKSTYPKSVLVVGPSTSLGGIASVMRMHSTTELWNLVNCHVLATYDERSTARKVLAMLKAYVSAPVLIHRAALVHFHVAAQRSMLRKLPIMILTKLMRKPYIVHLHAASESSIFELTPQWLVRMTFLLSYRVIVLSDSWAKIVKNHVPDARVTIIHNPVLTPKLLTMTRTDEWPVILFVGKLESRKGYRDLLEAAVEVLMRFPRVQIWFVGHGEIEQGRLLAKKLGIDRSVMFSGWINSEDMEYYYRAASIFCLPSYDEGLPMAVLEAMSYGLPVVCTPVGGLPDLISDGRNGFFAQPGDVQSIASQLLRLLRNPELATRTGVSAAQTIERECGIARIEHELGALYQEVDAEWVVRRSGQRESTLTAGKTVH